MTTTQKDSRVQPLVPEVLADEHHEAIRASWELPAYQRPEAPAAKSRAGLGLGLLAAAVGLAVGFGAGYLIGADTVQTPEPFVVTSVNGPVDANGATLGRRVPAFATALPFGLTIGGPVDANGMTLGRRVPPPDTTTPTELPRPPAAAANGMTLGRRVPENP